MSDSARKKFKFVVAPTDRQLWAIGMVAVQWSLVENAMKTFVHCITDDDADARAVFDESFSFKKRHRLWRDLTSAKMAEPWRTRLIALIDRVAETQSQRDRIVHGAWGDTPGVEPHTEKTRTFDYGKPRPAFDWKLDYGQILEVALRIDALHDALMQFIFDASHVAPGESVLASAALQRILRKPNPDP